MATLQFKNGISFASLRLCVRVVFGVFSTLGLLSVSLTCQTATAQDASLLMAPVVAAQPANPLTLQNSSFIYRPMPPEAQFRELQLNDIITVIVDYRSTLISEGDARSKRNLSFNAVLSDWVKFDGKSIMAAPQNNGDPRIRGQLDSQYKTEADVSARDALTFRIAAQVVDIRPNGNLVIEARSEVQHDEEVWEQSLTGVVRRQSIGPDRTVRSDDVAERRIRIRKKGFVRDGLERGWFTKWYDCWKPF